MIYIGHTLTTIDGLYLLTPEGINFCYNITWELLTCILPRITKAVLDLLRCCALVILKLFDDDVTPSTNGVQSMFTRNGAAIIGLIKAPRP